MATDLVAGMKPAGTRYFQVDVATGALGFCAVALPGQVAQPSRTTAPPLAYGGPESQPSDPVFEAVGHFLGA